MNSLRTPTKSSPPVHEEKRNVLGSMKRLHSHGYTLININTGEYVTDIIIQECISGRIEAEGEAKKIIFALRDKCIRSETPTPTLGELRIALVALRVLWLLLPPIERIPKEKGKDFFIRILKEVSRYRHVDMFAQEN